eukprot:Skav205806  [mRNA]  locus=scaffold307:287382:294154:- [translate_table: standard]
MDFRSTSPGVASQAVEDGLTLTYSGEKGTGLFFQWDGESRFAFSPTGDDFHIHIRKILNIPVVLGPNYDPRVTGEPENGQPLKFSFCGQNDEERRSFAQRVLKGVQGQLNEELLASSEEMQRIGLHLEAATRREGSLHLEVGLVALDSPPGCASAAFVDFLGNQNLRAADLGCSRSPRLMRKEIRGVFEWRMGPTGL